MTSRFQGIIFRKRTEPICHTSSPNRYSSTHHDAIIAQSRAVNAQSPPSLSVRWGRLAARYKRGRADSPVSGEGKRRSGAMILLPKAAELMQSSGTASVDPQAERVDRRCGRALLARQAGGGAKRHDRAMGGDGCQCRRGGGWPAGNAEGDATRIELYSTVAMAELNSTIGLTRCGPPNRGYRNAREREGTNGG